MILLFLGMNNNLFIVATLFSYIDHKDDDNDRHFVVVLIVNLIAELRFLKSESILWYMISEFVL